MSDLLLADVVRERVLTDLEARHLVDSIRVDVTDLGERVATAYIGRAWTALGYDSWDALCEAEFDGARLRIPREQRAEQVQSLRSAGLSTRAIGTALGVSDGTVRNDLSTAQDYAVEAPAVVTSLDGRTRPATQPPRPAPIVVAPPVEQATVESAVARYPELTHYSDQPGKAVTLAGALDGYGEQEREVRRDALAKRIAAEQSGRLSAVTSPASVPSEVWDAEQMFAAANSLTSLLRMHHHVTSFQAAALHADPLTTAAWRDQFADLAGLCAAVADCLTAPALRSVR